MVKSFDNVLIILVMVGIVVLEIFVVMFLVFLELKKDMLVNILIIFVMVFNNLSKG